MSLNGPGTNYFAILDENVKISLTNDLLLAILAECDGNPNVIAVQPNVYNTGCEMIRRDILTGNNVYYMTGTTQIPVWTLNSGGGGSGTVTSITGLNSVRTSPGTITTSGNIDLVNDSPTPGSSYFYGTNSSGVKGWFDQTTIPAGVPMLTSTQVAFGDAANLMTSDPTFTYDITGDGLFRVAFPGTVKSQLYINNDQTNPNIIIDSQGTIYLGNFLSAGTPFMAIDGGAGQSIAADVGPTQMQFIMDGIAGSTRWEENTLRQGVLYNSTVATNDVPGGWKGAFVSFFGGEESEGLGNFDTSHGGLNILLDNHSVSPNVTIKGWVTSAQDQTVFTGTGNDDMVTGGPIQAFGTQFTVTIDNDASNILLGSQTAGNLTVGQTITGNVSGATGVITGFSTYTTVNPQDYIVYTPTSGTFVDTDEVDNGFGDTFQVQTSGVITGNTFITDLSSEPVPTFDTPSTLVILGGTTVYFGGGLTGHNTGDSWLQVYSKGPSRNVFRSDSSGGTTLTTSWGDTDGVGLGTRGLINDSQGLTNWFTNTFNVNNLAGNETWFQLNTSSGSPYAQIGLTGQMRMAWDFVGNSIYSQTPGNFMVQDLSNNPKFVVDIPTALIQFNDYPDSRDDTGSFTVSNFLYTDNTGGLRSAPISSLPSGSGLIGNTSGIISGGTIPGSDTNTWLGAGAGNSMSVLDTVAIGNAGQAAANAHYSIFIGSGSGSSAVDAATSVFIGFGAGGGARYSRQSTFLGNAAGSDIGNQGAAENSFFVGQGTGQDARTAANSVFLGDNAGNGDLVNNLYHLAYSGLVGAFQIGETVQSSGGATATLVQDDSGELSFVNISAPFAFPGTVTGQTSGATADVDSITEVGSSILIGVDSSTGGFSNSIGLGRGAMNTAENQLFLPAEYDNITFAGLPPVTVTPVGTVVIDAAGRLGVSTGSGVTGNPTEVAYFDATTGALTSDSGFTRDNSNNGDTGLVVSDGSTSFSNLQIHTNSTSIGVYPIGGSLKGVGTFNQGFAEIRSDDTSTQRWQYINADSTAGLSQFGTGRIVSGQAKTTRIEGSYQLIEALDTVSAYKLLSLDFASSTVKLGDSTRFQASMSSQIAAVINGTTYGAFWDFSANQGLFGNRGAANETVWLVDWTSGSEAMVARSSGISAILLDWANDEFTFGTAGVSGKASLDILGGQMNVSIAGTGFFNIYNQGTSASMFSADATSNAIIMQAAIASDAMEVVVSGSPTISNGKRGLYYDPATLIASATITLPSAPVDGQEMVIAFGGTISGTSAPVVTLLTIAANTGQTLLGTFPTTATTDTVIEVKWRDSTNQWYRTD